MVAYPSTRNIITGVHYSWQIHWTARKAGGDVRATTAASQTGPSATDATTAGTTRTRRRRTARCAIRRVTLPVPTTAASR